MSYRKGLWMRLNSEDSLGGIVVVLRRRSERILTTLAIAVLGVGFLLMLPTTVVENNEPIGSTVGVCFLFPAAMWFFGAIRAAVTVVYDGGLLVREWFTRYRIPWSAVSGVEAEPGVAVQLTDGTAIGIAVGGGSLLNRLRGNRYQHGLAEQIEEVWERSPGAGLGDASLIKREWALGVTRLVIWLVLYLGTLGVTLWGMALAD